MSDSSPVVSGVPALVCDGGLFLWRPLPLIVVVSGTSGAGKDSIIRAFMERQSSFHFVVTATSRDMRDGEIHGVDYHFFSREEFETRVDQGEFLEHALVYGDYKGVPRWEFTEALASGKNVIMRVDIQGACTLQALLPDAVFVFVMAESEEEHLRRLEERKSDDPLAIKLRLAKLREEVAAIDRFDYLIINKRDCMEEAVDKLCAIVTAEQCRVEQKEQRVG